MSAQYLGASHTASSHVRRPLESRRCACRSGAGSAECYRLSHSAMVTWIAGFDDTYHAFTYTPSCSTLRPTRSPGDQDMFNGFSSGLTHLPGRGQWSSRLKLDSQIFCVNSMSASTPW